MVRVWASLLVVLTLPACAMTPPSSMFASLSGDDGQEQQERQAQAKREAAPAQPPVQQAGISGSIGGLWDSVKSGLSFDNDTTQTAAAADGAAFDPAAAQQAINVYRAQKGLKPVTLNPKLSDAARGHSEDMAKSDRISHFGSDGSDAWDRVQRTGYPARLAAENVATGQRSLNEVLTGWQQSSKHNANLLLSDAEEIGIAMVYKPNTQFKTFWTLVLGARD